MIIFEELSKELLANPEFKKAYDALAPKYEAARALIKARIQARMTSKSHETSGSSRREVALPSNKLP